MNLNKDTKQMTETAVLALVMALLSTISLLYVPVLFLFLPVPFIVLGIKNDLKSSYSALIVSMLLTAALTDIVFAGIIAMITASVGTTLVILERRKFSSSSMIGLTCLMTIFTIISIMALSWLITGFSFLDMFVESIDMTKDLMINGIKDLDAQGLLGVDAKAYVEQIEAAAKMQALLLPTGIVMMALTLTYSSFWASVAVLRKMQIQKRVVPKLERFALPDHILVGFLVIGMGTFVVSQLDFIHYEALVGNILALASFILSLQGFAVGIYLLRRSRMPKVVQIIMMIFTVLFVQFLLPIIGLVDIIVDLRKIKRMGNGDRDEN